MTSKLIDVQFSSPWFWWAWQGCLRLDQDPILCLWSFFLDVDGLKNFPWEILRLLFLNLDVVSIYLVSAITPRNMFINRFGSRCPFDSEFKQESLETFPDSSNLSHLSIGEIKVCRRVMVWRLLVTPAVLKVLRNCSEDPSFFSDTGSISKVGGFPVCCLLWRMPSLCNRSCGAVSLHAWLP